MIRTTRWLRCDDGLRNVSKSTNKLTTDYSKWKLVVSFIQQINLFVPFILYVESFVSFSDQWRPK